MSRDCPFPQRSPGWGWGQQEETPKHPGTSETSFPIIVLTTITLAALKVFTFIEHILCPQNRAESFLYIPLFMLTTTPTKGTDLYLHR